MATGNRAACSAPKAQLSHAARAKPWIHGPSEQARQARDVPRVTGSLKDGWTKTIFGRLP